MMEIEEMEANLSAQEADRVAVYIGLAEAYRKPTPNLPKVLTTIEAALVQLGSESGANAARLKEGFQAESETGLLEVEFTMLFLGPFLAAAPPYGSVYLEKDRRLMGDSTVDARKQYLDLGFDLLPDFKEAPDHICVELEFMSVLIRRGMKAIGNSDYRLLSDNLRRQKIFLTKHLGAWISAFADRVSAHSQTDYYRSLASITRAFVAEDIDALPEMEEGWAPGY